MFCSIIFFTQLREADSLNVCLYILMYPLFLTLLHNLCCFISKSLSSSASLSCKVKQSSLVLFCSSYSVKLTFYSKKGGELN